MFFKSRAVISVCPPYVKYVAVSACQFVNHISIFIFRLTSRLPGFCYNNKMEICALENHIYLRQTVKEGETDSIEN